MNYADLMLKRIEGERERFRKEFSQPGRIPSFVADDLLPAVLAQEIYQAFPKTEDLILRNTIRERKYVTSEMNEYNSTLKEIVFAFHDPRFVSLIGEITGLRDLEADSLLYAAGISAMSKGCFLNPHLDNSHDYEKKRYRVLNLLYYVTPGWEKENGGHLELWDRGVKQPGRVIESRFNRLVVMSTFRDSWHSVSPVQAEGARCCVSNYYFSPHSVEKKNYYHVTSFRGRPEEKVKDWVLRGDLLIRNAIGKMWPKGNVSTFHVFKSGRKREKTSGVKK
jgi:Rps23 Pro-64 3,4-dihydroxylase Tpa1-like proline 4-hydroxylase